MDKIPTLESYVYQSSANGSQTYCGGFLNRTFSNQPTRTCLNPMIQNSQSRPQQQLIQEEFINLNCKLEHPLDPKKETLCHYYVGLKSVNEKSERVTISIKYQDRNKLEFGRNFRDENRRVNGCPHRDDKLANKTSSDASAPSPKKKWIRHYMTGKV